MFSILLKREATIILCHCCFPPKPQQCSLVCIRVAVLMFLRWLVNISYEFHMSRVTAWLCFFSLEGSCVIVTSVQGNLWFGRLWNFPPLLPTWQLSDGLFVQESPQGSRVLDMHLLQFRVVGVSSHYFIGSGKTLGLSSHVITLQICWAN